MTLELNNKEIKSQLYPLHQIPILFIIIVGIIIICILFISYRKVFSLRHDEK